MANTTKRKKSNPLVGTEIQPTSLDSTTKIDIDTNKVFIDNILEAGVSGGLDLGAIESFTSIANSREQLYQLIDSMANDANISAILRTYAADCTDTGDNGHVIWCEAKDPSISKFVNYLLNVMNADKNMYSWAYNLAKYGDLYLKLYRDSDYEDLIFKKDSIETALQSKTLNESKEKPLEESINIKMSSINDHYSYYVEAVSDPGTIFELTKYGKSMGYIETPNSEGSSNYLANYLTAGGVGASYNYKMKSNDINIYQADDLVHASLEDNYTRFPETVSIFTNENDFKMGSGGNTYNVRRGKSMLQDPYKIWRERTLLESSVLLNRVTRSSVVRTIQVEVGDMPKTQVQQTLRRIKEMFEQKSSINTGTNMTEYSNPGPIENNIYLATHGGQGSVSVASVGGDVNVRDLADLDRWDIKLYAAFGIPRQFMGLTDEGGFNGGTSLAIISTEYAKNVRRVQNALIQMVTDAINLFLLEKGCKSYINNFVLKMKSPATQEEIDYRAALSNRINAVSSLQGLFTDVETRSRRLKLLKAGLSGLLEYNEEQMIVLDEEIDAAEEADRLAAEEKAREEEEARLAAESESKANNDLDLELPTPEETTESIKEENSIILTEDGAEFLTEDENNLPVPESLNIDFTENK